MAIIHDDVGRRRFLSQAVMGFGLLFGMGLLGLRFFQFLVPAHKPKRIESVLLGRPEVAAAAGGLLGVAQLGQGTLAPIVTVATGGAMTLILISTLAVGDLVVRHMMKRRPRRRG